MQAERSGFIDNSVSIGEDKYRWRREFREEGANGLLHEGSKAERSALPIRTVNVQTRLTMLGRNLR